MTTSAAPLLWRYHARALASAGQWSIRIAIAAPVVTAALMILLSGGDASTYERWFSDDLLPLLGSLTVAAALWPEMRSGALRTWAASPDRAGFRWLLQRSGLALAAMAVLILAGMLVGTIVNLLLGIVPQPAFVPGFFVGYLFMAALTLAGTLIFRHPFGGAALALAYWLVDLRLGAAENPLMTLHATTAEQDGKGNLVTRLMNKPMLLVFAASMLALCAGAAPRLLLPVSRREVTRTAGLLVGGFLVVLLGQVVVGVGILYVARGPAAPVRRVVQTMSQGTRQVSFPTARATSLRHLTAPMEKFKPLPVSLLFGPVYHGLVTLPASDGKPATGSSAHEATAPRIRALTRLVNSYGSWPWADTAAHELAVTRTPTDGVAAMSDYWNLAQRYPNSPYAPDALAAIMNTSDIIVFAESKPNFRSAQPFTRSLGTLPLQPRLSAAIALLQRYPDSAAAVDARAMALEYYPALIRPEVMETVAPRAAAVTRGLEKAHWLTIQAEIELNNGRYAEADKTLKQAREEANRSGAAPNSEDEHVAHHLQSVEEMLELWRSKQQTGGGR